MKAFNINVDRVAIAGADENVRPEQLAQLSRKYPFVEWSILYTSIVRPLRGFPSVEWIRELVEQSKQLQAQTGRALNLSIHLCGMATYELLRGRYEPLKPVWDLLPCFQRMQLNANFYSQCLRFLAKNVRRLPCRPQFIIQLNGNSENEEAYEVLLEAGFDAVMLHDRSGGRGVECDWLPPVGSYCGYAGGLKPENLQEQILAIARVTNGQRIYLDLQSGVRSKYKEFVLGRAEEVLRISQSWIQ